MKVLWPSLLGTFLIKHEWFLPKTDLDEGDEDENKIVGLVMQGKELSDFGLIDLDVLENLLERINEIDEESLREVFTIWSYQLLIQ